MPLKNGKLTRMEKKFAATYADTGNGVYSAAKAGYVQPETRGAEALQRPGMKEEIRRIQVERLFQEVLPLAVKVHLAILADDKTPAGARVQAVKLAYDRTLGDASTAESKQAHEMSPDELAKAIADAKLRAAALEHVAADRAKPIIEHEPDVKPSMFD
jgi:phage terminase small subunit